MAEQRPSPITLPADDPRLDINPTLTPLMPKQRTEADRVDAGPDVTNEIRDQHLTVNATPVAASVPERGLPDRAVKAVADQQDHEPTEHISGQGNSAQR